MKFFKYTILLVVIFFSGCTEKITSSYPSTQSYSKPADGLLPKKQEVMEESLFIKQPLKETTIVKNDTIAIVYPSMHIGKYALEATNSINTYLLYKGEPFSIETYDIFTQDKANILEVFQKIQEKKITKVIAMITKEQVEFLGTIKNIKNMKIFLPLVNKYEINDTKNLDKLNIIYGAINYKEQFKKLLAYGKGTPYTELYDNTQIGTVLHSYLGKERLIFSKMVDDNNGNYQRDLKNNQRFINGANVILNTPIVKSSMLLSSITAQELYPAKVLSTQLNFTPLIFSLTQVMDRKGLIVASSIGKIPDNLIEYNELLGNGLLYNWVNYASIVGAELLSSDSIKVFEDLKLQEKQIIYPVKLYEVRENSFRVINF